MPELSDQRGSEDTLSPLPSTARAIRPISTPSREFGREYRLVYDGKMRREDVLALTPAAPWQRVREFCSERPHAGGWRNLLVWGDNLPALRELLADQQGPNRYGTRNQIKLIYIDPPFATRQDFMKDREKAYRDKVAGASFIEFLRKRLILLREILASDGSIFVHLDTKKGHYIKAVLDEVFGEETFQNEIIWKRTPFAGSSKARAAKFPVNHDSIFFYSKSDSYSFKHVFEEYSAEYKARFKYQDETGWYRKTSLKTYSKQTELDLRASGRFLEPQRDNAYPSYKQYLHESKGKQIEDIWIDINIDNPMAQTRANFDYPTLKPERLLERILECCSKPGDIVLDCFAGSGTTAAVAEKLGRRWIAMDCGKLAIYTIQKRLFSLTTAIGSTKKDDRDETGRVEDWAEHLKNSPGIMLITEKARNGDCEITLSLLKDLAALIEKHRLLGKSAMLSLACPKDKLKIPESKFEDPEDGPGSKCITIGGVEFRISIIAPKEKTEKDQPLPAKAFDLYRAGVYDMEAITNLPWADYRPFVLKLFGVSDRMHTRYGSHLDGYIGTDSCIVWNYPDAKDDTLDYGYVDDVHKMLRGKPGERFYIIAPVVAMSFAEDEVKRDETTYVFLKVPLSVLVRLIKGKQDGALKQPAKEADVNEVIDAVGFDFVTQPEVKWSAKHEAPKGEIFSDYVVEVSEFRAKTLATDLDDFRNFETFSMALVDTDYDGEVFRLSHVFWGSDLVQSAGGLENAKNLQIRISEAEFTGSRMMVILCDRYGNEKCLALDKKVFGGKPDKESLRRRASPAKKGAR